MTHLQTIQTTNHVSPNIHENPKSRSSLRYVIPTENSTPIIPKANKPQESNLQEN